MALTALPIHRSWGAWRAVPLRETAYRLRVLIGPVSLGISIALYYWLWTALFRQHSGSVAGLDVHQTVTYAILALLAVRVRWSSNTWDRDAMYNRVRDGTIIYWFLRPISPARYYMVRGLGDVAYGASWCLLGYVAALAAGVIELPRSTAVGAAAVLSVALGQVILYYLAQLLDLLTFWLISNTGILDVYKFVQSFLAGVYVPLWFLPSWLVSAVSLLPFSASINIPASLYVGRLSLAQAPGALALQGIWIIVLAATTRCLWIYAYRRVPVQGG